MPVYTNDHTRMPEVNISPEVLDYIGKRNCDFRICTSCGGPILLPVRIKPPKKSDILIKAGSNTIYISIHQVRFLQEIRGDMIPFFDDGLIGHERG
jgi:hypothetical protein